MREASRRQIQLHSFDYEFNRLWIVRRYDVTDTLWTDASKIEGLVITEPKPAIGGMAPCSFRGAGTFQTTWKGAASSDVVTLGPAFGGEYLRLPKLMWPECRIARGSIITMGLDFSSRPQG